MDLKKYMDQLPADGTGLGPDMVKRFTLQLISGIIVTVVDFNGRRSMVSFSSNPSSWFETSKSSHRQRRKPQTRWLWPCTGFWSAITRLYSWSTFHWESVVMLDCHIMVSSTGSSPWIPTIFHCCRYVVSRMYICRNVESNSSFPRYILFVYIRINFLKVIPKLMKFSVFLEYWEHLMRLIGLELLLFQTIKWLFHNGDVSELVTLHRN